MGFLMAWGAVVSGESVVRRVAGIPLLVRGIVGMGWHSRIVFWSTTMSALGPVLVFFRRTVVRVGGIIAGHGHVRRVGRDGSGVRSHAVDGRAPLPKTTDHLATNLKHTEKNIFIRHVWHGTESSKRADMSPICKRVVGRATLLTLSDSCIVRLPESLMIEYITQKNNL